MKTRTENKGKTLQERLRAIEGAISAPVLARLLGLSRITVYKRASLGDIPCLRLGGVVRFDPETVARWLDENEVTR